ncbi:uncharacterized protein [Clytia hemisphaerica]|uniref:uncharacterized protein n=1 Tax=Clytia hemisphaerica TaxID=252671 RepID=UPI0034D6FE79
MEDSRPGIGFLSSSESESSDNENESSEPVDNEMKHVDRKEAVNERSVIGGVNSSDDEMTDDFKEIMESSLKYDDAYQVSETSEATRGGYMTCSIVLEELIEKMTVIMKCLAGIVSQRELKTLVFIYQRLTKILYEIQRIVEDPDSEVQIFLFQDGPCTKAVKDGSVLVMRDLNLPSQAVIERLNSLLEPLEAEFCLNEDFTLSSKEIAEGFSGELTVPKSLKIIGTVNTKGVGKKLKFSPALRSRMTVIETKAYTDSELVSMLKFSCENMDEIQQKIGQALRRIQPFFKITSKDVFRLKNFVDRLFSIKKSHFKEILAIGIIYLWVDRIPFNYDSKDIPHPYKFVLKTFDLETEESMISIVKGKNFEDEKFETDSGDNNLIEISTIDKVAKITNTPLICPTSPTFKLSGKSNMDLFLSKSTFRNVCRIFAASASGLKLLLNGPPGVGKTKIIKQLSNALGFKCTRINFSANTTYDDLIGSFLPIVEEDESRRTIKFQEGILLTAMKESETTWILFDELNLADPSLLQRLMPLFTGAKEFRNESTNEIVPLKNLQIFATKNPEKIGGGRNKLPDAIDACFTKIFLAPFDESELKDIGNFKMKSAKENGIISDSNAEKILEFHNNISRKVKNTNSMQDTFNLRDLEKFILLMEKTSEFHRLGETDHAETFESKEIQKECIRTNLNLIYGMRVDKENNQTLVQDEITKIFSASVHSNTKFTVDTGMREFARIGHLYVKKGDQISPISFTNSPFICQNLVDLAAAIHTGLAILIQGGNSAGKTSLVRHLSQICQRKLIIFPATKDTTIGDLIGSWTVNNDKKVLEKIQYLMKKCSNEILMLFITNPDSRSLLKELSNFFRMLNKMLSDNGDDKLLIKSCFSYLNDLVDKVKALMAEEERKHWQVSDDIEKLSRYVKSFNRSDVHFVFAEGPLLEAIKRGFWFLLDNIGQVPGDVLERLNSLLEVDPELVVCAGAKIETFNRRNRKIHTEFRFIATNNTERKGHALSTAVLNRCLVINLKRLDVSSTDSIETIPAFDILCHQFKHVENRRAFVSIILKFHRTVVGMQRRKERNSKTKHGLGQTFRSCFHCISSCK